MFEPQINFVALFGAEVADRTFYEFKVRAYRLFADFANFFFLVYALNEGIRSEFKVNIVRTLDEFARFVVA